MAEGTPNQGPEGETAGQEPPKKLSFIAEEYDPNKNYTFRQEGIYSIAIDPQTGREVARMPIMAGGALPDWLKPAASNTFSSSFKDYEKALKEYAEIQSVNPRAVPSQRRFEFHALYDQRLKEYQRVKTGVDQIVNNAIDRKLLHFVIDDFKTLYARATRRPERSYYFSTESTTDWHAELRSFAEGTYKETFWNYGDDVLKAAFGNADIGVLKEQYEGVGTFIASKIAVALEKELKGIELSPTSEIGDRILTEMKAERIRAESRRRERATADDILEYSDWRERFDFNWAQTREELELSVFAWLEKFVAHLPEATIEELNNESLTWRRNAISALEKAANRLHISEKEPSYKELKNTIIAYVEVFRGVKFLETDGGAEAYTVALEEFAHDFNDKHDAIYLGNVKSAIIQAFLARNHGIISMGNDGRIEKPQAGDIEDFRGRREEQAKIYAATHELYIRPEDFQRRSDESNAGYGWNDVIEELLLVDSRGMAQASILTDPVARAEVIEKVATRTGVFKRIKERLDKADEARDGRSFSELSDDERREEIRFRIRTKMFLAGFRTLAEDIDATIDVAEKDRILWDWLKKYNGIREKQGHTLFFPSNWDEVRLKINRETKLVDRVLSDEELDAMIEEVGQFRVTTGGTTIELKIDGLTDEEIKAEVDALPSLSDTQRRELLEDALFDKQQRETEAERALNINRAYQKFLGVDARWGGMAVRVVNDDGDLVLRNVWDIAQEILKAKIDKEETDIEAKVIEHEQRLRARFPTLTDSQVEKIKTHRRRLLRRDSTFGATLALREIGIANDLPIWNYYYYNDPQRIQAFAPLAGYTHNDKPDIVALLDRGRKEMRAVWDYLADTYMDGRVLIVRDEANADVDANGQPKDFHKESLERARVINEAGVSALREIFESRFMLSTSGGIEVVDLISKIGDLGVYDLLWEMGCKDFREFQGFIKRRDEVELRKQSFWNTKQWRDPITYAKRVRGGSAAIPYLRGGDVKGQRVPGVLQEPMMGAYKFRDEFFASDTWIGGALKERTAVVKGFRAKLQEELEKIDNLGQINPRELDKMVEIGAGILQTLIAYMDARRYVANRAGLAPKNWKYDNELIFRHYAKELLKRVPIQDQDVLLGGGEKLGDEDLGYAVQGRSALAVKIFENILRTSSYHILVAKDRKAFDQRGKEVKNRMDSKRAELQNQGLLPEEQHKIDARRNKLLNLHTSQARITEELERMRKQYIEERLHKEFVGEWAAGFAEI